LGFVLTAAFVKAGSIFKKHGVLITVALCFTVSLTIEIVQAWMPLGSSDCLDLVFNTLGAFLGATTYGFFCVRVHSEQFHPG
jgi:glycopeptide antibiotics resistance protein